MCWVLAGVTVELFTIGVGVTVGVVFEQVWPLFMSAIVKERPFAQLRTADPAVILLVLIVKLLGCAFTFVAAAPIANIATVAITITSASFVIAIKLSY